MGTFYFDCILVFFNVHIVKKQQGVRYLVWNHDLPVCLRVFASGRLSGLAMFFAGSYTVTSILHASRASWPAAVQCQSCFAAGSHVHRRARSSSAAVCPSWLNEPAAHAGAGMRQVWCFMAGGRIHDTVAIYLAHHVPASSAHLGQGMRQGYFFRLFGILSRSSSHVH